MESRQRRIWHQAAGALFYTRFAQCHARLRRNSIQRAGALIPYQACGLDNKKGTFGRQKFLFCWCGRRELNPSGKTTRPSNVRVCQFRHSRRTLTIIAQKNSNVNTFFEVFFFFRKYFRILFGLDEKERREGKSKSRRTLFLVS